MYGLTVWKLAGPDDAVETKFECKMETHWQAVEIYDCVTRGIRGHYRAWLTDDIKDQIIGESEVSYSRV